MSKDNCTSFGVDDTNSNIGAGAVMNFVKPLVMELHRDANVPHADTQNQVEDCKLYTGIVTSSVIQKKCTAVPSTF